MLHFKCTLLPFTGKNKNSDHAAQLKLHNRSTDQLVSSQLCYVFKRFNQISVQLHLFQLSAKKIVAFRYFWKPFVIHWVVQCAKSRRNLPISKVYHVVSWHSSRFTLLTKNKQLIKGICLSVSFGNSQRLLNYTLFRYS